MSDDEGWEARMAARHAERVRRRADEVRAFLGRDEPLIEIAPEINAARILGIEYGDPGPRHAPEVCRECWGERKVWLGNCWGLRHVGDLRKGCQHSCHEGEVWLAAS